MTGPLHSLRIVEVVGLGAAPYCGMLLADLGAQLIRVDRRIGADDEKNLDPLARGRPNVALNLKSKSGIDALLRLTDQADAVFEGFRPGVAERLGFGPDVCRSRNEKLVYGRLTGWGQEGPLSSCVGHDINFIALSGVLHAIGPVGGSPSPPLNLLGDFAGGGMLLAMGLLAAMLEARSSGRGQVVDAAMVDGAASLMAMAAGHSAVGSFDERTGCSLLGGNAPYYRTYLTKDQKYIAVGPLETRFLQCLIRKLELDEEQWLAAASDAALVFDDSDWALLGQELETIFATKTRDDWSALLEGTDACVSPVLSLSEARNHPHNKARRTFVEIDGVWQPAPVPRFSSSTLPTPTPPQPSGRNTRSTLHAWGFSNPEIDDLCHAGGIPGEV